MKDNKYFEDLEKKGYYNTVDKRSKDYREYKEYLASKESYETIKDNISKENKVGLGDVVEAITKVTSIKKVVEAVTDDCGCNERKERFNKITLWNRKKVNCISEDDYLWYKQNIKPSTSRFDYDTRERIVKIYNSIFNTNQKNTKCMPCMKGLLENINNYLVVWEK